jgi:hypothetical protein
MSKEERMALEIAMLEATIRLMRIAARCGRVPA